MAAKRIPRIDDYLTTQQAAAALGLARDTVQIQARKGRLRAEWIGGRWLIEPAAIEEYRKKVQGRPGRK